MDLFDYISSTLRDTFLYFKSRTKQKYEGDRFEEWVVAHSNIQRYPDIVDSNSYWRLLEWRGDKYTKGWYPLSNLGPDLVLECNKYNRIIAVECKYRNKRSFWLDKKQVLNYEHYCNEHKLSIDTLYYLFGFEWEKKDGELKNGAPKEVYLIPSEILYKYDKKTDVISFCFSQNELEDKDWYKKYQIHFDNGKGLKYIQYLKNRNSLLFQ